MSRNRLSLILATFLLIATLPLGAQTEQPASRGAAGATGASASAAKKSVSASQAGETPAPQKAGETPAPQGSASAAKKTASSSVNPAAKATSGATSSGAKAASAATHTPATGPARWKVIAHGDAHVPAFLVGSWQALAAGSLQRRDFQEVSPPDIVAALGLATVNEPDSAGWFVSAGTRAIVKTTDEKTGYPTRSYESWANLGWAVGVTSGSATAARVLWESNSDKPLAFTDLVNKAVAEAPGAGAWIVAGQVEFATARGQALAHSPVPAGLNASTDTKDAGRSWSKPVEDTGRSALMTAVVVSPDSPVGRQLIERFLPADAHLESSGAALHVYLAHYALFQNAGPRMDTSRPFQALWPYALEGSRKAQAPQFETVRRVLDGTTVARAYLSVWAIDSLMAYPIHEDPDLVEPAKLDPTILEDQGWARPNPQFKEPIYDRPRLVLRRPVAEAIVRVNKRLAAQGYRLKLWDAYRPLSMTQIVESRLPGNSGTYLASPVLGSRHNRGAAVDCTLTDMEGRDVEVPSPWLAFDERAHRDPGPKTPRSAAATHHMNVLTTAMQAEGFTTIGTEWWHYDAPGWRHYRVLNVPLWPAEGDAPSEPAAAAAATQTAPATPAAPAEPPHVALPPQGAAREQQTGAAIGATAPGRGGSGRSPARGWLGGIAVLAGIALFSAVAAGLMRHRRREA